MLSILNFGNFVVGKVTQNIWFVVNNLESEQLKYTATDVHENDRTVINTTGRNLCMYYKNIVKENKFTLDIEEKGDVIGQITMRSEHRCSEYGPCAKHKITTEISQGQHAQLTHFLDQCSLVKINDIPTRGLTGQFLYSTLLSLADDTVLLLVVKTRENQYYSVSAKLQFYIDRYKLEINEISTWETSDIATDSDAMVCQNTNCVHCDPGIVKLEDSSLDIDIDFDIEIQHVQAAQLCYIQHVSSQLYLKIKNHEIITYPLQKGDKTMVYNKKMYGGHAPDQPDGQAMVLFIFKEVFPDHTAYVCGSGPEKISLTKLPPIQSTATILNSFDTRLFRHTYQPSKVAHAIVSCFESTCYPGSYLAVDSASEKVKLKLVKKSSVSEDPEIQFLINYQTTIDKIESEEDHNTDVWKKEETQRDTEHNKCSNMSQSEQKMCINMSKTQLISSV